MKNQEFSKMAEDDIMDIYCTVTHELADLARVILDVQKDMRKLNKTLDQIDTEMCSREANKAKQNNQLN